MFNDWDFNLDDLDGSFYEAMSRSVGHTERWRDEDGNKVERHHDVFTPEDGDDHRIFSEDARFFDDTGPVYMPTGHDPENFTSLTDAYIDLGDDVIWAHGIYQTDGQDPRELRDSTWEWDSDKGKWVDATGQGRKGSYNTGEQERRDKDRLLDPGARKLRDRQRIYREGHKYNDRKLAEHINRMLKEEAEYALDPEQVEREVAERRAKTDFQFWLQECGGKNGKPVGERRAQQIAKEITEELDDEQRDQNETVIRYRAAREAGWLSPREESQLEPTGKWAPYRGDVRQQYDPTSDRYSRSQMASIASQLIEHDGDVSKVRVPIERTQEVNLLEKSQQSEEIARLTEEFLQRGGEVEHVAPEEDSWTPEFRKKMKYRWLRWNRW